MNKIRILVVNYFNNYIGSFTKSKSFVKNGIGGILLLVFGLIFIFLFSSMAVTSVESALSYVNNPNLNLTQAEITDYLQMPLYVSVGTLLMLLMLLTVTKATSTKKDSDSDLLLALPVTKTQIITSKTLFNYVFDLGMIATTILPSFIIYYVMIPTRPDVLYLVRIVYLILVFPMLSNAIGSIIGTLFTFLTRKFVKANAIRSIISVFFLVMFLLGYYALQFYFEIFAKSNTGFAMSDIFVLKFIVDFLLGNNWLINGLIFTAICVVPFVICIIVSSLSLGKHVRAINSKKKELVFKKTSITKTLLEQEIGRYFSSSVYVINTLFGGVILVVLSLIYLVLGQNFITEKILTLAGTSSMIEQILSNSPIIMIVFAILVTSTIVIACTSISFEGKNIWIIKANPIDYKKVFTSKILCNFIVACICILISSIFFGIRFIIDAGLLGVLYTLGYIILTSLFALLISVSGLFVNLIFPKLDWQSETEIVKQSMSVGIGLLVNMVLGVFCIIPLFIFLLFTKGFVCIIGIIISIVLIVLLTIGSIILLNTVGKKLYSKL